MSKFDVNTNWIREQRSIYGAFDLDLNLQVTAFLGLFNGQDYFHDRIRELQNQNSQNFYLLVVDNYSERFVLKQVLESLESIEQFSNRWMVVRNPINLGGLGSFQLNIDLVPSPWVTFFHQDDSYSPNHVSTHLKAINDVKETVKSVSTDLGTLTAKGEATSVPPRSNWFIDDSYPEGVFVANVSEQVIPFPALSVRKSQLELNKVPWHTVAFSDSELSLFILMTGSHVFIPQETVLYRENPSSESHSQGETVRHFSATLGLLRVFSSQEFIQYASKVQDARRHKFLKSIKDALQQRIPNHNYQDLVWAMVLEQTSHAWAYHEPASTVATKTLFQSLGESYTPSLLSGILSLSSPELELEPGMLESEIKNDFLNLSAAYSNQTSVSKRLRTIAKSILFFAVGMLPYPARRKIHQKIRFLGQRRKSTPNRSNRRRI